MKRLLVFILGVILLSSCDNKGRNVDASSEGGMYSNRVFYDLKEDSSYAVPSYFYSTDWMEKYVEQIRSMKARDDGFDHTRWSLAYVNNDTIPEMLLDGGCWLSASIIMTQYDGKVYESSLGGFPEFIDGADGLLYSGGTYKDDIFGSVYEMSKGQFMEKFTYSRYSDYYDTTEIDKFGLDRDWMGNWLMDDGTVGVSVLEVNGKVVAAHYGINISSEAFAVELDSIYYSKGNSIEFPQPGWDDEEFLIETLLQKM